VIVCSHTAKLPRTHLLTDKPRSLGKINL